MNTIEYGQGAVNNTIGWGQGAKEGGSSFNTKSIDLDGVDDFVALSSNILTAQDFSLSIWFKGGVNTGGQQLIDGQGNFWNFALTKINGAGLNTDIAFWNGSSWISLTNGSTGDNQWHNLVVTFEDGANNLKAYYDGSLTFNGTYDVSNSDAIKGIGYNSTFGRHWQGFIDEVAVWTSELSASDVTSIYNSGVPNDLASLSPLSWWRCGDNDTAPTLTDNGSGGNNGTMTNFSTFSTDVPT